jgi:hypothetical protein
MVLQTYKKICEILKFAGCLVFLRLFVHWHSPTNIFVRPCSCTISIGAIIFKIGKSVSTLNIKKFCAVKNVYCVGHESPGSGYAIRIRDWIRIRIKSV